MIMDGFRLVVSTWLENFVRHFYCINMLAKLRNCGFVNNLS